MSYATIAKCAADPALQARVTACCAEQGSTNPSGDMVQLMWELSAASDIAAAYAAALAANNDDPGGDESVVTDQMILANVQAHLSPPEPPTSSEVPQP